MGIQRFIGKFLFFLCIFYYIWHSFIVASIDWWQKGNTGRASKFTPLTFWYNLLQREYRKFTITSLYSCSSCWTSPYVPVIFHALLYFHVNDICRLNSIIGICMKKQSSYDDWHTTNWEKARCKMMCSQYSSSDAT